MGMENQPDLPHAARPGPLRFIATVLIVAMSWTAGGCARNGSGERRSAQTCRPASRRPDRSHQGRRCRVGFRPGVGSRPRRAARRRQRGRRGRGDRIRAGRHLPRGGQHRRRRVHADPPGPLPRAGPVGAGRSSTTAKPRPRPRRSTCSPATSRPSSHLLAGVPGTVRGLALAHAQYGKLPWKDLVEPAVALAEDGFAVDADLADVAERALAEAPAASPSSVRVYGKPGGGLGRRATGSSSRTWRARSASSPTAAERASTPATSPPASSPRCAAAAA